MKPIAFFIPGKPQPGGSKRAISRPGVRYTILIDACKKNASWKQTVAAQAKRMYRGDLLDGPLCVTFAFCQPRPKYHFKKNGERVTSAPTWVTVKPDVLKLARAVEDALTGVVWVDDARIVVERMAKVYSDRPGVWIHVREASANDLREISDIVLEMKEVGE